MQAIPTTTHMILPEGILSTIEGTQLIPVETTSRFLQKTSQGVSIVELGKKLLKSSKDGNTDQVRDLMSKGAPFTTDWLGTSPLHFAALNNHFDTCEVLLRAGISRDSRTKVDRTPLHMAAYEGHINIVELLLSNGAAVDSCDMLKMTPLHWAVQNGHADVVTLLLRQGANPDVINKFGKSPVDISIEVNRLDILHLLQVITKDPIDATQSLALELGAEDKIEEVIKHPETLQKHFLDQDDESENKLTESLDTAHVEVQQGNTTSVDFTDSIQMLKEHGISFLPADNSSVVASAVENGHSLVLTEVGKQVLNSTKPMVRLPVQKSQITKINGRQVIAIRPDQFLALSNSSNNQQNRVPIVIKNTTQKPFKKIVMNKNKIIYSSTPNITNAAKRIRIENVIKTTPPVAATPVNIELIQRQLAEARREAEEYKQMLKRKEAEAERYKRQLQSITQQSK